MLPLWSRGLISQFLGHFTDGGTPWTGDQLVARPLPKHRTTQTQNKRINTPNIHSLSGIRTHDPGFRASEDSTCLRPLGYRHRLSRIMGLEYFFVVSSTLASYMNIAMFTLVTNISARSQFAKICFSSGLCYCVRKCKVVPVLN
jgi:hypothetical protein